jgi:protein-disulfide isomerase
MNRSISRIALICAVLLPAVPPVSFAQESQKAIATVDGQPIYEGDLMSVAAQSLLEARKQEYKVKSEALESVIRRQVVVAEAKRRGLRPEELLKQEVDSKVPEPSDAEAKAYYLAARNASTLSFEELKPQLKRLLRSAEIEQARLKYADSLRAKAEIAIYLRPPGVEVAYDPARVKGNPDAPVTVVEFSDFQCPYCRRAHDVLKEVLSKYDGKVKLAYRDFPLSQIHPNAESAAEASRCAGAQGKFWQYHDSLFAEQSKLDKASLTDRAKKLGLDAKAFQRCLDSGEFKEQIQADEQDGQKVGVTGTPGFFVNGVFLSGAQPLAEFEKVIDNALMLQGGSHEPAGPSAKAR